jgi:hypothetical protein
MKITYLGLLLLVTSLLVLKIRAEEEGSTSLDNKPANPAADNLLWPHAHAQQKHNDE